MKKLTVLMLAAGMLISVVSLVFTGCTKEGPAGKDGSDANATCTQCHNFGDTIVAKIFQYDASQHATGSTTFESNRNACAPCHSSQGYQECLQTGQDTTAKGISDPAPINCRTCHMIHETYTSSDWGLRGTDSYTLRIDHTITMNLAGTGNLCGRCHQARKPNPWVTNPTGSDTLKVTSFRWGPHYGTQSLILGAKGAFEFGSPYGSIQGHANGASCNSCHGASAVGNLTGGHTLKIANEEEGDNLAGCNVAACHNGSVDQDWMEEKQTEIETKFETLRGLLLAANIIDSTDHIIASSSNPKWYTQKELAVVWNFLLIEYDRSWGIHNYNYAEDLLDASIAAIQSKK
jgi:hypothetical protein